MDALKVIEGGNVDALMADLGRRARVAARRVALASAEEKTPLCAPWPPASEPDERAILAANAEDLADARDKGQSGAFIDRLVLNPERLEAIAEAVESIAELPDPVGRVLARFERPNGLKIERVATPLGVIGVIFESRPNVTADAGALCLKAGNAAILRAGSESFRTSLGHRRGDGRGLGAGGPAGGRDPASCRPATGRRWAPCSPASTATIDVIVPRGGKSLVARVQEEARVPVFAHLEGLNHVYVHGEADLDMAKAIVLNAKMRRTGVCGAAETLLVDRACAGDASEASGRRAARCRLRGARRRGRAGGRSARDARRRRRIGAPNISTPSSRSGSSTASTRRIAHIETYGSHHTDAIVTDDEAAAERFLAEVDSAIVLHNASTQFADGGEFGFGAEIGIATGRMHARGPVGVEQLTSFKYRVRGSGQTRP